MALAKVLEDRWPKGLQAGDEKERFALEAARTLRKAMEDKNPEAYERLVGKAAEKWDFVLAKAIIEAARSA